MLTVQLKIIEKTGHKATIDSITFLVYEIDTLSLLNEAFEKNQFTTEVFLTYPLKNPNIETQFQMSTVDGKSSICAL